MPTLIQTMKEGFRKVDLPIEFVDSAVKFGTFQETDAFLLDIRRKKGGSNEFRDHYLCHVGGSDNVVEILSTDTKHHQLVIQVLEPERVILTSSFRWVRNKRVEVINRTVTSSETKWYLTGEDEGHLFICQLPFKASTVKQAHEILKPRELRNTTAYKRQGEWFFLPLTTEECGAIDQALYDQAHNINNSRFSYYSPEKVTEVTLVRSVGLGRFIGASAGRPHVADEIVKFNNMEFARGRIVHPDHVTRTLKDWHRVLRNTEVATRVQGTRWAD